jgi:hypothetical protein
MVDSQRAATDRTTTTAMIRKLLCTVGIGLLAISTSFAKLGENRAQSIARYGYPINIIGNNILVYKTEKYNVVQYFNSLGFVEAIGYQRLAGSISQDDINAIRAGNHLPGPGGWTELRSDILYIRHWRSNDGLWICVSLAPQGSCSFIQLGSATAVEAMNQILVPQPASNI